MAEAGVIFVRTDDGAPPIRHNPALASPP